MLKCISKKPQRDNWRGGYNPNRKSVSRRERGRKAENDMPATAQPILSDIPADYFLKSLEETIKMVENTLYYEDRNKSYLLVVTENVYRLLPPNDWAVLCHYKNMYLHIVSAADLPNQYSAYFMQVP